MLPLFRKITDDTKYLEIAGTQVAVLGRIKGNRSDTFVDELVGTTLEPVATTRIDLTKKLGIVNAPITFVNALGGETVK